VRRIHPRGAVVEAAEVEANMGARTRVLCLTWVHSFSGWAIDVESIGALSRQHDVVFVLNGSQAIGARELDVRPTPVDAVVGVGFEWLCGLPLRHGVLLDAPRATGADGAAEGILAVCVDRERQLHLIEAGRVSRREKAGERMPTPAVESLPLRPLRPTRSRRHGDLDAPIEDVLCFAQV